MNEKKEVYTAKEAADRLGVHCQTLHDWEKKGYIKPYRLGKSSRNHRRYPFDEVERVYRELHDIPMDEKGVKS